MQREHHVLFVGQHGELSWRPIGFDAREGGVNLKELQEMVAGNIEPIPWRGRLFERFGALPKGREWVAYANDVGLYRDDLKPNSHFPNVRGNIVIAIENTDSCNTLGLLEKERQLVPLQLQPPAEHRVAKK